MTRKSRPMTAAQRDALIAEAQALGMQASRTSKDLFIGEAEDKQRVTPGELKAMIESERLEAAEKAEAFEAAEEIRRQEAAGSGGEDAQDVKPAALAPEPTTARRDDAKPPRVVIKYGPPCGGDIAHLPIAVSEDGDNPLVHYALPATTKYASKAEAAAAGKACARGHIAFMATDGEGTFWLVACVNAAGVLEVDGQAFTLSLLDGERAVTARAALSPRLQAKSQWVATAA